jgi:hypothetical protein
MYKKFKKYLSTRRTLRIVIDFFGIIILWRGVWGLLDVVVFPGNELLSSIVSVAIGLFLVAIDGDGLNDLTR